jgi:CRISPR-associated protein Cmr1
MRKKICEIPDTFIPCVNELKVNAKILTKTYCFELITPLLGGDHESWKLDLKRPVREQSLKGQLRFWWRAMQGEENNKILLDFENNLWGGVTEKYKNGRKSQVSIYLSDINVEEKKLAEMKNKRKRSQVYS